VKYVGIKNSAQKSELLRRARKVGKVTTIQLPSIAGGDCSRHRELLAMFDAGETDFREAEYYKYQKNNGKKHAQIIEKIERFRKTYESIRKKGYDYSQGHIVVTSNGARLDGSHRSSIVEHLGFNELDVLMIDWESVFPKSKLRDVYAHIEEQQKRYNS